MIYKVYNDDTWTETETAVSPPGSILPCFSWSMFSSSFTRRSKDTYLLLLSDKCCNFELTLKVQCRYVSSLASWVCCSDCCCCPLTSSGAAAPQEVGGAGDDGEDDSLLQQLLLSGVGCCVWCLLVVSTSATGAIVSLHT